MYGGCSPGLLAQSQTPPVAYYTPREEKRHFRLYTYENQMTRIAYVVQFHPFKIEKVWMNIHQNINSGYVWHGL